MAPNPVILFDMDGTLTTIGTDPPEKEHIIESSGAKNRVKMKHVANSLGIPKEEIEPINRMALVWNSSRRYAETHNLGIEKTKRLMRDLNVAFQAQEDLEHAMTLPVPETITVLQRLADEKFQLGVVTSTSRKGYNRIASNPLLGGFSRFFNHSITRDDCQYIKPDPEPINRILSLMNVTDFIYVGDSDHDAYAAHAAGGQFILLNTNKYQEEKILSIKPEGIISSLNMLYQTITELRTRL